MAGWYNSCCRKKQPPAPPMNSNNVVIVQAASPGIRYVPSAPSTPGVVSVRKNQQDAELQQAKAITINPINQNNQR